MRNYLNGGSLQCVCRFLAAVALDYVIENRSILKIDISTASLKESRSPRNCHILCFIDRYFIVNSTNCHFDFNVFLSVTVFFVWIIPKALPTTPAPKECMSDADCTVDECCYKEHEYQVVSKKRQDLQPIQPVNPFDLTHKKGI